MTSTFSTRQRPSTVNLTFTDNDLTDNFQDNTRSSFASESSTARGRHPRGDTPLSKAGGGGGAGVSSATSASRRGYGANGGSLSNLDRLLDFLDDEEQANEAQPPRNSSTPIQSTSKDYDAQGSAIPPSTIRRLDSTSQSPDSPSPRPGSVAAMRSGERSFHQQHGYSNSFQSTTTQRLQDELIEADREQEEQRAERPGQLNGDELEEAREGSVDSITRVAQAALQEFDTIISRGGSVATNTSQHSPQLSHHSTMRSSSSTHRPPSRLRNIPTPTSIHSRPLSQASSGRSQNSARGYQDRSQKGAGAQSAQYAGASAVGRSAPEFREVVSEEIDTHDLNLQLIDELREAQDYISFLQTELRTIGSVVNKLRDRNQEEEDLPRGPQFEEEDNYARKAKDARQNQSRNFDNPLESPGERRNENDEVERVLQSTNRNAFEIVKHLIAMIPNSQPNSSPPSIESITSSLEFVRKVDSLVHRPTSFPGDELDTSTTRGDPRKFRRRDEVVFERENLERLENVLVENFGVMSYDRIRREQSTEKDFKVRTV